MIINPKLAQRFAEAWRPELPDTSNWPVLAFYGEVIEFLPPNPVCVEIGVAWGRSLLFLASICLQRNWTGARLYGVDPQGRPRPPDGSGGSVPAMRDSLQAMTRHGSAEELQLVQLVQLDSRRAARSFDPASVDLVFVDGDHTYEGCRGDLEAWEGALKPGGIIAGDDYWPMFPGVQAALVERYGRDGIETWHRVWWRAYFSV